MLSLNEIIMILFLEIILSGSVGLVISQTLILVSVLQFGVLQVVEVTNNVVSVERILQYTKLNKEGPFQTLSINRPPRDWPSTGTIVFRNLYLKYSHDEPPVLKNLNFEINSGEKVRHYHVLKQ